MTDNFASYEGWKNFVSLSKRVRKEFRSIKQLSKETFHDILKNNPDLSLSVIKKISDYSGEDLIGIISACYLSIKHPDPGMEIRVKLHLLLSIPFVGIGTASYLMALHEPSKYAWINSRTWQQLFKKEKKNFGINDYLLFLDRLKKKADRSNTVLSELNYKLSGS